MTHRSHSGYKFTVHSQFNWFICVPCVTLCCYISTIVITPRLNSFLSVCTVCFKQTCIRFSLTSNTPSSVAYDPHNPLMNVPLLHLCLVGPSAFYCLCLVFTKISTTGDTLTSPGPLRDPSASAITPFFLNWCWVSKCNNSHNNNNRVVRGLKDPWRQSPPHPNTNITVLNWNVVELRLRLWFGFSSTFVHYPSRWGRWNVLLKEC